jgi:large subunit ribosomal protein L29
MLNMTDIKKLDADATKAKLAELRRELFEIKFHKHTTGIEKSHFLKDLRKDIARLLTALNSK